MTSDRQVERRLAAILAVDVVGYSRLMGEDEAGTAQAVREHREAATPIIREKRGRIVKTMGDGLLLEFPSVVAATESAIAVQKMMVERNAGTPETKRVVYRIGVHIGDVLIDGDDILGEGVNIAARLEGICEPGGVCLSAAAYEHVRGRVEANFVDLGEKALKNIARPVRVYSLGSGAAPQSAPAVSSSPTKSEPSRLSIVVLPFANIGGDPDHEYFVDGVTESLTTDLSRIRGSFVIARNTAFTFKGKPIDIRRIGRELNVRYALEGSVQRGGNRLRVNVQLVDAESGAHLWAERFEKPVADLFDLQDEIVARMARQLDTELIAAEARRAERSPHPDSMDLYLQGAASWHKGPTRENLTQARELFDRALALDPNNVDALAGHAWIAVIVGGNMTTDDPSASYAAAEAAAKKALSIAPNHAMAHFMLGSAYALANRAAQAIEECDRALTLDRNLAGAHAVIGLAKNVLGHGDETEAHIQEALRLSPRDVQAYVWMHLAGAAKIFLGRDEEAVAWYRRSIEVNRSFAISHFFIAAALAQLDRKGEAAESIAAGLALNPTFTIRRVRHNVFSDNPTYLSQRERLYDGLRKAGVPEE